MEFRPMTQEEIDQEDKLEELNNPKKYDWKNPPKHTGLFFRGYNHVYYSNGQFAQKRGYRLLKRKSCKGCPTCDFILNDLLQEDARNTEDIGDIKNEKLYELVVRSDGGSYEYPNDVDYWAEFIEVKE